MLCYFFFWHIISHGKKHCDLNYFSLIDKALFLFVHFQDLLAFISQKFDYHISWDGLFWIYPAWISLRQILESMGL